MTARPRPSPPPAARWIVRTLEEAGFETWAVGGALRDALLGVSSQDWDFATRARPADVRRAFRRTVPIGVEHGTVGVLSREGVLYEVTTFRRDVETSGRHAVVEFADSVEEDLARRDFTVNALAWHPLREEWADPFGGADDLESGVLRTVGAPADRFAEDYLRVLRALRFAGRFELRIDGPTWSALCGAVDRLDVLSAERVREELEKVLAQDPRPSGALALWLASGAAARVAPELGDGPDPASAGLVADVLPRARPLLRLAALLRGGGGPEARDRAASLMIRLRFSNAATDRVASLAAGAGPLPGADAPDADRRRWLSRAGPGRLRDLARLELARARVEDARAGRSSDGRGRGDTAAGRALEGVAGLRRVLRGRPPLAVGDLVFGGRDLIAMGLRPGPRFGEILDDLLAWVLEDPARNEAGALRGRAEALADAGPGGTTPASEDRRG